MKVTVKDKYLNVRVGEPRLNAPCNQYIAPGSQIEVTGALHTGDYFDGTNTWYADNTGNYYWAGGVNAELVVGNIDYTNTLGNLPAGMINNRGDKINIVIVDSGIVFNGDYFDISKTNSINVDQGLYDDDHAVFIGGIIAGIKNVTGVATNANITSLKFTSGKTEAADQVKNLVAALTKVAAMPGPLVMNLSQGFTDFLMNHFVAEKKQILTLLDQITAGANKFIICAAEDNLALTANMRFPSYTPNCISVGCVGKKHQFIPISSQLNILSPQVMYTSFGLDYNLKDSAGSSFATAMISSIVACMVSVAVSRNITLTKAMILAELKQYSTDRSSFQFDNIQSFQYQII
jgi:hypothetical protein